MDIFQLQKHLIDEYSKYASSFINIADESIKGFVLRNLENGSLWRGPYIGLNPQFEQTVNIKDLTDRDGKLCLHPDNSQIFTDPRSLKPLSLYKHQLEAIEKANEGKNYVITTGTGSGKSLTYIIPIIDHILKEGTGNGIKAIVIYPMNALANSQQGELDKYLKGEFRDKVRYKVYTGQTKEEDRQDIRDNHPDIILTNYAMLELILTRPREAKHFNFNNLRYIVLDELHSYRGRQGADVALLLRRLQEISQSKNIQYIGTSATLSTDDGSDKKRVLAEASSVFFGKEVEKDSIIDETVIRQTKKYNYSSTTVKEKIKSLAESSRPPSNIDDFNRDYLASWLETEFGIEEKYKQLSRKLPQSLAGVVDKLSATSGLEKNICKDAIICYLLAQCSNKTKDRTRSALTVRIHQFIGGGDTIYSTLEPAHLRSLSLSKQKYYDESRTKLLMPIVFCRVCGQDYYSVYFSNKMLIARQFEQGVIEECQQAGYFYTNQDKPWSSNDQESADLIPEDWLLNGKIRPKYRNRLPRKLSVKTNGEVVIDGNIEVDNVTVGWWFPEPFHLCLACGFSYSTRTRGRDSKRLSTLTTGGRSTITTVLSLLTIKHLMTHNQSDSASKAKFLSFVDNRQDASFQAGHLNDFVDTVMIRSALYRALKIAGNDGIRHDQLSQSVFKALDLPRNHYDINPEGVKSADVDETMYDLIAYRLYVDFKLGWRQNQPNLEQTDLLNIEYLNLDDLVADQSVWDQSTVLVADKRQREEILTVLLDYVFRRKCGVDINVFDSDFQYRFAGNTRQYLNERWAFKEHDRLQRFSAFSIISKPKQFVNKKYVNIFPITHRANYGKYLKRQLSTVDNDDINCLIKVLIDGLTKYRILKKIETKDDLTLWQLSAASLVWKLGSGKTGYSDPLLTSNKGKAEIGVNKFFIDLYQGNNEFMKKIRAEAHTAQVDQQIRKQREGEFRRGELPILYCSPTMELGIDIDSMNVVNMRNVPPTPANYAQRSGRAGRNGQPALVVTYCANGNNHDQYFFKNPGDMISGQVRPPRLNLNNQDLVRSHIHALWLYVSGLDLGSSIAEKILDVNGEPPFAIKESVRFDLNNKTYQRMTYAKAEKILKTIEGLNSASWYSDDWLDKTLKQLPQRFKDSLKRWQNLYQSAQLSIDEQNERMANQTHVSKRDMEQAKLIRGQAEKQRECLKTNINQLSDFYSYRYLASEGFLPGYSFPRLPLTALVSTSNQESSYIQRPRFIALREFGPKNMIYHEGSRYRVERISLNRSTIKPEHSHQDPIQRTSMKQCDNCGYIHPIDSSLPPDLCRYCQKRLGSVKSDLLQMSNVYTVRQKSITSEEEERIKSGYRTIYGFRFVDGKNQNIESSLCLKKDGKKLSLFDLTYVEAMDVWSLNMGWANKPEEEGFDLDINSGQWAKISNSGIPNNGRTIRSVTPYVNDTCNAMLLEPKQSLPTEVMASIAVAIKIAIEEKYQLEPNELMVEPLPSRDNRKLLLFYESSEGGAGVLRQLAKKNEAWHDIADRALRRCHFGAQEGNESCRAGCYECLFTYYNQLDHDIIDRQYILKYLKPLKSAEIQLKSGEMRTESKLEQDLLDFLKANNYRLPDKSQQYIKSLKTRPDFVYIDQSAVIYVDGIHHDFADRQTSDSKIDCLLEESGYTVIRFNYKNKSGWNKIVKKYPHVFGDSREK